METTPKTIQGTVPGLVHWLPKDFAAMGGDITSTAILSCYAASRLRTGGGRRAIRCLLFRRYVARFDGGSQLRDRVRLSVGPLVLLAVPWPAPRLRYRREAVWRTRKQMNAA